MGYCDCVFLLRHPQVALSVTAPLFKLDAAMMPCKRRRLAATRSIFPVDIHAL